MAFTNSTLIVKTIDAGQMNGEMAKLMETAAYTLAARMDKDGEITAALHEIEDRGALGALATALTGLTLSPHPADTQAVFAAFKDAGALGNADALSAGALDVASTLGYALGMIHLLQGFEYTTGNSDECGINERKTIQLSISQALLAVIYRAAELRQQKIKAVGKSRGYGRGYENALCFFHYPNGADTFVVLCSGGIQDSRRRVTPIGGLTTCPDCLAEQEIIANRHRLLLHGKQDYQGDAIRTCDWAECRSPAHHVIKKERTS